MRIGLVPSRGRDQRVYLWDSIESALEFPPTPGPWVLLEVRIPRKWASIDSNYLDTESSHGHSYLVTRKVSAKHIKIHRDITISHRSYPPTHKD